MAQQNQDAQNVQPMALDVMSQALLDVSGTKQKVAEGDIQRGTGFIIRHEVNNPESELNTAFKEIASPDEKVFATLPSSGKVVGTWGGTIKTAKNGDKVFVVPKQEYRDAITSAAPMNHRDVAQRAQQQAGAPVHSFDLSAEMKALQDKRGEDLLNGINIIQSNIDQELAKSRAAVRTQAMIQSGATEAQAALQANIALDREKGFTNQATVQTAAAQKMLDSALVIAQRLEAGMIEGDSRVRELMSAKESLKNNYQWRAQKEVLDYQRDVNREEMARQRGEADLEKFNRERDARSVRDLEKREFELEKLIMKGGPADRLDALQAERASVRTAKTAALRATVTDQNLANYQYVYGTSGDDNTDRMLIVSRRDKEKDMVKVLNADFRTIYDMLSSTDAATRQAAYKLVDSTDKVLNDPATAGMDSKTLIGYLNAQPPGKLVQKLKEIADSGHNVQALAKFARNFGMSDDQIKEYTGTLANQGGKEVAENNRKNLMGRLLSATVNAHMESQVRDNVLAWKTSELAPMQPLERVLSSITPTKGVVKLEQFVDTVLYTKMEDPTNPIVELTNKQKLDMIGAAVRAATANASKTMLFPADNLMAAKLEAEARSRGTWAMVKKALSVNIDEARNRNPYGVDPATWLRMGQ